jgi:exopolyphosphatase / guanosine-5'-triphosphate,3'-diphosphate pyrophosphatase
VRIAALDLGSNSFHLVVVEAHLDGSFVPLVREKEMLRLGDVVTKTGAIGEPAQTDAIAVLRRFRAIADAQRADEVLALGTSALREATDGPAFCERARDEAGIDIAVVDGIREAQLIFTAIRHSILLEPAPALCGDLGGGSLEIMVGDRRRLAYAASLHLGVGRLTAEIGLSDPPTQRDLKRLRERIATDLDPVIAQARRHSPKMLVGTSGTFLCLAKMAVAHRDGSVPEAMNQLSVHADDLRKIAQVIYSIPTSERADLPGCDTKRAELLPAGMVVLEEMIEQSELEILVLSEWALREGIVLEAIGAHDRAELSADPRALRRASILSLCRRSNWRQPHARRVAAFALELFDATREAHHLGPDARELLELAALAHDIGEHVSRVDHDRHGAYLIENGGLRGFAPEEIRLLACVVRLHIRGNPRTSIEQYAVLDAHLRQVAVVLIALLRVADALDASHAGSVQSFSAQLYDDRFEIALSSRGEAEVERWALRRKTELLERVLTRAIVPIVVPLGPAEYEADVSAGLG